MPATAAMATAAAGMASASAASPAAATMLGGGRRRCEAEPQRNSRDRHDDFQP